MLILHDREWWPFLHYLSTEERCQVVEELHQGGHISDWQLWEVLSNHQSPIPYVEAIEIYHNLGFQPHVGYPLTRKEKHIWVTWETVDLEAYFQGFKASRLSDSDPSRHPNPYQPDTISWQSFNWGWNTHDPDDPNSKGGTS